MKPPILGNSMNRRLRVASFVAMFLVPGFAPRMSPAACIDYGQYLHWVSSVATASGSYGVACQGEYAYVAADAVFEVVDVSNQQAPGIVGVLPIGSSGGDIVLSGTYAYLANWDNGLSVIDVANPQNPVLRRRVTSIGSATGLAARGDYLFLTTVNRSVPANSQLEIFSIAANPVSPQLVGRVPLPNYGWDVAIAGDYAYIADDEVGIVTIDISDPTNPVYLGVMDTPGVAHGVSVAGDVLFDADFYSLQIATISDPALPQPIGALSMPDLAFSAVAYGSYVCVGDYGAGLRVVDVTNPSIPRNVGAVDTEGLSYCVAIDGTLAYIADGNTLQIVSLSSTPTDVPMETVATPGAGNGIAARGDYAYVADYGAGLQIVKVANIPSPAIVGSVDTPGSAVGVALAGDKAIVADAADIVAVDVSQPTSPRILGITSTPAFAHHVAVSDIEDPVRHAYVADGTAGLLVADISGDRPVIVGSVDTSSGDGQALTVTVSGGYAFVADTGYGLVIADVSDPSHPTIVSSVATGNGTTGVAVDETRVYVVNSLGLYVFDVTDIRHPSLISFLPTRYVIWPTVTVDQGTAYLGGPEHEFAIADVSIPSAPKMIGGIRSSGYPVRAAVLNCSVYIADQILGLLIVPAQMTPSDAPAPGSLAEIRGPALTAFPNPLQTGSRLSFDLSSTRTGELQILDVGGRRVRELLRGEISAGHHVVPWDGRDDDGRRVASGTYFLRLGWRGGAACDRLVVIR